MNVSSKLPLEATSPPVVLPWAPPGLALFVLSCSCSRQQAAQTGRAARLADRALLYCATGRLRNGRTWNCAVGVETVESARVETVESAWV